MKEIVYPYADASGQVLYEVVRRSPKGFYQRRPNGSGGYVNNLNGVARVPYRLSALIETANNGGTVYVVEGEKDADRLAREGLTATTSAQGTGWLWPPEWAEHFRGCAEIVVIADNDKPGLAAARQRATVIAQGARGWGGSVKLLGPIPGIGEGGDASDFLDAGGTTAALVEMAESAEQVLPTPEASAEEAAATAARASAADDLIELAREATLFHTPDGDGYAWVPVGSHLECHRLTSKGFALWLRQRRHAKGGKAPSLQAVSDAVASVEAQARFDGPERSVALRLGEQDGAIVVDLGAPEWETVWVDRGGWQLQAEPPLAFWRPPGMRALPRPEHGGDLSLLREFVNVDDESWPLLVAFMVASLRPRGPYPVLVVYGEHGSAKTTVTRVLRSLVDPVRSPVRAAPKDERDLAVAAQNGYLLCYDNLSSVAPWLSDGLCRLSTGGGLATRRLYSDDEEVSFDACRPVVLNGIEELAARPDLLDRAVIVRCPAIPDDRRRDEEELWAAFEAVRPRVFGAVLDALAVGLDGLSGVRLERKPRMADFARFAVACEPALGIPIGSFLGAYEGNRLAANELALEASSIAGALSALVRDEPWSGTLVELLDALAAQDPKAAERKNWPKSPRGLTSQLGRVAPNLRAIGITCEDLPREPGTGRARLRVTRQTGIQTSQTSQPHKIAPDQGELL